MSNIIVLFLSKMEAHKRPLEPTSPLSSDLSPSEVAHGGLPRIICPICALAVERIRAGGGKRALWLAQCTRDPCRRALRQSSF